MNRLASVLIGMGLSVAAALDEACASEALAGLAFGPRASGEGGIEYRTFHDLDAATGDLHAVRFDEDGLRVLWRAARRLERAAPDERIIITQDRAAWAGLPFTHGRLNASQRAVLDEDEVNWQRGEGNTRRLGPIVGSEPVIVGAPQAVRRDRAPYPVARGEAYSEFAAAWAGRTGVVYVNSNNGLLHAFDAANGDEVFAYVPNKLIDGDQRFATRLDARASSSGRHLSVLLPTPTVEDAFVMLASADARKAWRTLLIGGLGEGGKGYFALDVTDPETSADSAEAAAQMVLWEFTDADDVPPVDDDGQPTTDLDEDGAPIKDLGYATSQARLAMSNVRDARGGRKWVAALGNGGGSTAGRAVLFVLFVDEGLDGWAAGDFVKLPADGASGLGEPALVDLDLNGTVDRAYAGDLEGNLHRFDMSSPEPASWSATRLFQARYGNGRGVPQPITARPLVFKHPSQRGFMVVFATGVPLRPGQSGEAAVQSLYGIWDAGGVVDDVVDLDSLVAQRMSNIQTTGNGSVRLHRVVADQPVDYQLPGASRSGASRSGVRGWRIDFDAPRAGSATGTAQHPGERSHPRLTAWGDLLIVTTQIPDGADGGAIGAVVPIKWATGGSPRRPVLDLNTDGLLDESDLLPTDTGDRAPAMAFDERDFSGSLAAPQVLPGFGGGQLVLAGGISRRSQAIGPPIHRLAGRLSWRELSVF